MLGVCEGRVVDPIVVKGVGQATKNTYIIHYEKKDSRSVLLT